PRRRCGRSPRRERSSRGGRSSFRGLAPVRCSNSRIFLSMKRRVCCSCLLRVSSCPQYGQRFHPPGYVRLHDVQRTLLGSGIEIGAHRTLRIVDENRRKTLQTLAKKLDYGCINDVPPFTEVNPSAENIAEWFARELQRAVDDENALVTSITIWEGPVNSVKFQPFP